MGCAISAVPVYLHTQYSVIRFQDISFEARSPCFPTQVGEECAAHRECRRPQHLPRGPAQHPCARGAGDAAAGASSSSGAGRHPRHLLN